MLYKIIRQLSKVDKHNLRKYDDEKELICTIKGTSSVVEDTKNLYLELFLWLLLCKNIVII